jgi:hypothetical protein
MTTCTCISKHTLLVRSQRSCCGQGSEFRFVRIRVTLPANIISCNIYQIKWQHRFFQAFNSYYSLPFSIRAQNSLLRNAYVSRTSLSYTKFFLNRLFWSISAHGATFLHRKDLLSIIIYCAIRLFIRGVLVLNELVKRLIEL